MTFFPARVSAAFQSTGLAVAIGCLLALNASCVRLEPLTDTGYRIQDLGTLGGASSSAAAIAETGTVAGESLTVLGQRRAFRWCDDCDRLGLGTLPNGSYSFATDISPNGRWIVGSSGIRPAQNPQQFADIRQGFVWTGASLESVGALFNPQTVNRAFGTSEAHGVNDRGQVVGFSVVDFQQRQSAFLWQDGVLTDIGLAAADSAGSRAFDINNAGQVVGDILTAGFFNTDTTAFLWQNGNFELLPLVTGHRSGTAFAINNSGLIAGWSGEGGDAGSTTAAVLWSDGEVSLVGMLDGDTSSRALGINDAGQVVGVSGAPGNTRAFMWEAGSMRDLTTLLPANSGWTLLEATDINNAGAIVGAGMKDGQRRAFLLQPPSGAAAPNPIPNTVKATSAGSAAAPTS